MKKFLVLTMLLVSCSQLFSDPITWSSPPDTLSTLGVNSSDPQVIVDSAGNMTAAWVENGTIVVKEKLFAGVWGAPTTISVLSGSSAPRLAVTPNNGVAIVWLEPTGIASAKFRAAPGGAWSVVRTLSGAGATTPALAGDNNNNFVAAWVLGANVQTSTKLSGGIWQAVPDTLAATAPTLPAVGMNTGLVLVVWHDVVAGSNNIYSANKTIGGGVWSAPALISDGVTQTTNPKVVVDLTGVGHAAWFQYDFSASAKYSDVGLQYALFTAGTTWNTPTNVMDDGASDPNLLTLSLNVDNIGNAAIFWNSTSNGTAYSVRQSMFPVDVDSGHEIGAADLITGSSVSTLAVDGVVTPTGDLYLAYMYFDPDLSKISIGAAQGQTSGPNKGAMIAFTDLSDTSNGNPDAFPSIGAAKVSGNLYTDVVWEDYNGSNTIIQSSSGTGPVPNPPTNLNVSKQSASNGIFTEYFNVLTWTATIDSDVVGYAVIRNGMQIAYLDSGVTQYTDTNRPPTGNTGTYMIASVYQDGSASVFLSQAY